MKGTIDTPLSRSNGQKTVQATGWFEWDTIPSTVTSVQIWASVDQNGSQKRCGVGKSQTYNRSGSPNRVDWDADVNEESNHQFVTGAADGGAAIVNAAAGDAWVFAWGKSVTVN
jgi:hypothetical protein